MTTRDVPATTAAAVPLITPTAAGAVATTVLGSLLNAALFQPLAVFAGPSIAISLIRQSGATPPG